MSSPYLQGRIQLISAIQYLQIQNLQYRRSRTGLPAELPFFNSHPTYEQGSSLQLRAVATLNPAASHKAANPSGESWRSWFNDASKTTSSAKKQGWTPEARRGGPLRLHREILLIRVTSRMNDEERPWWNPHPIPNKSDLRLALRTELPLHLYREYLACSNRLGTPYSMPYILP